MAKQNRITHLACQTSYSFGSFDIKHWVKKCKELNIEAISFAESGNMGSTIEAYDKFTSEGIKYIPSVRFLYIQDGLKGEAFPERIIQHELIFVAKNYNGYKSLIRLNNHLHRENFFFIRGKSSDDNFRVYVTDKTLKELQIEDVDIIVPLDKSSIGDTVNSLFYNNNRESFVKDSLTLLEEVFSIKYGLKDNTHNSTDIYFGISICDEFYPNNTFRKICDSLKDLSENISDYSLYLEEEDELDWVERLSRSITENDFMFITDASYPTKEDESISLVHREMASRFFKTYPRNNAYLRTELEVIRYINKYYEGHYKEFAAAALKNNILYKNNIDVEIKLNEYKMPQTPMPDNFSSSEEYLEHLVVKGWNRLAQRSIDKIYRGNSWGEENDVIVSTIEEIHLIGSKRAERVMYEYQTIKEMGFVDYFIIVADICRFCDEFGHSRSKSGRGSAAGSILSYLLGITGIDPIDSPYYDDLLFERFLNPARKSMPDIDLDFSSEARDAVIEYCKQVYGKRRVVNIGTYLTLKFKSALKAYHRNSDSLIPNNNHANEYIRVNRKNCSYIDFQSFNKILTDKNLAKVKMDQDPHDIAQEFCLLSPTFKDLYEEHTQWIEECIIPVCRSIIGRGIHPAGILILPEDIDDSVPIRFIDNNPNKNMVSQYGMNECEMAGYIKVDFLNVDVVDIIARARQLVKSRTGVFPPSEEDMDLNDPMVLAEIKKDSYGIFQFKSPIQRQYLPRLSPENFGHLSDAVAVCRTGPMQADAHEDYLAIRHGNKAPEYEHPIMASVLESTGGLIIYQEQVMKLLQVMADFTLAESDLIRRAIGKKKPEELKKYKSQFIEGCKNNNISEDIAESVWTKIDFFSGYGFNLCVTGETEIDFALSGDQYQKEEIAEIPVAYAYYAMHADAIFADMLEQKIIDANFYDKEDLSENLMTVLKHIKENHDPKFNMYNKMVMNPSSFRNEEDFIGSDTHKKLIDIYKTKSYGPIVGFDGEVGVKNHLIDIVRLKSKAPVIQIKTALQDNYLRGAPLHRVVVYNEHKDEFFDLPLAEVRVGDLIVCLDRYSIDSMIPRREKAVMEFAVKKGASSPSANLFNFGKKMYHKSWQKFLDSRNRKKKRFSSQNVVDYKSLSKDSIWGNYGIPCYLDRVISKDFEETPQYIFEVIMDDPYHRYSSNNIISHNSHAVSYTALSFEEAYLRTYYPIETWCAILSTAKTSRDHSNNVYELKDHLESIGVDFEYPNLYNFHNEFLPIEDGNRLKISWPISKVIGISDNFTNALYEASGNTGKFDSIEDMFKKIVYTFGDHKKISMREIKPLFIIGFFDYMKDENGKKLSKKKAVATAFKKICLYKGFSKNQEQNLREVVVKMMDEFGDFEQKCEFFKFIPYSSKKVLPYSQYIMTRKNYEDQSDGAPVLVGGILSNVRPYTDKNGNQMYFLEVMDYDELYNIVVFSSVWDEIKDYNTDENFEEFQVGQLVQIFGTKNFRPGYGFSIIMNSYDKTLEFEEEIIPFKLVHSRPLSNIF